MGNRKPILVGQRWEQRNGEIREITSIVDNDPMPVKSGEMCWQSNGRYWMDGFESKYDLIRLIPLE